MALKASDELRHPHDPSDFNWRESLYFNFNDPVSGIGGWLYLWVVPNKPQPSGMLVSFYKGPWPEPSIMDEAATRPGHIIVDGDRWLYCVKHDVDYLMDDDFDDVELNGLKFKRLEPLKHYALSFADDAGNGFEIDARFMVEPYDYGDGANASPPWIAANRYHRSWQAKGTLRINGATYPIDCTGDSDHSWGKRDMDVFGATLFKMWSFQTADGRTSLSAVQIEDGDQQIDLGFLHRDGQVGSITRIDSSASYDAHGVQEKVDLTVTDALGRTVHGTLAQMTSYLGLGGPTRKSWGYEGVGDYEVDGLGTVPGLVSYFWPMKLTPAQLHAGGTG
jgi:hypothetical protein